MYQKLTNIESIPDIVKQMTLEEKALLVTGNAPFSTTPIPRLGIPAVTLVDGATGANLFQLYKDIMYVCADDPEADFGGQTSPAIMREISNHLLEPEKMSGEAKRVFAAVVKQMEKRIPEFKLPGAFPSGMLLGATWDPETVWQCGSAVGKEMDAHHIDVVLGPNVNIHRDPRNGRVYEGYSEDPYLASALAPEFVKGVQSEGVLANAKHFAANNQETFRHNVNVKVSERAMYEIYLPAFKACVDAGVKTVMSAYNQINGKACSQNDWLLKDVLRDEWGFEGMVVSDWFAVYDQVEAIRGGNDLDMPGKRDVTPILKAVHSGKLPESALDNAVSNVLKMILQTPAMTGVRKNDDIDRDYSRKAAYQSAAEGIVLLGNNGVLPLQRGSKLSMFGKRSHKLLECGSGSTFVQTDQSTSLFSECKKYAGGITFGQICEDADAVLITACAVGQEGSDRSGLDFEPGEFEMLMDALEKAEQQHKKTVLLLNISGPVDLSTCLHRFDAVLCLFLPGMEGARAAADILFGCVNPSGKLPLTFPKRIEDVPSYYCFPGIPQYVEYGEGIFVGYRGYDERNIQPLFPFGYGLSYTTFEISNLKLSNDVLDMDEDAAITATVTVKNTGTMAGKEVIQLYLSDPISTLPKPKKELKAFQKVYLETGEEKQVSFVITKEQLRSYDDTLRQWTAEAGCYDVLVGNCSNQLHLQASFTAVGQSPYGYREEAPLIQYLMDPVASQKLQACIESCGWDFSKLNSDKQYYPDRPVIRTLNAVYPFAEHAEKWKLFFEEMKKVPVREFSYKEVANWQLENL